MTSSTRVDAGPDQISRRVEVGAPAATLFAILADPHRHGEIDGSGSVGDAVAGPSSLSEGDRFTVSMSMFGLPYKITSRVTALEPDRLIEWQHPAGHRWRWSFEPIDADRTEVTETFDYRGTGIKGKVLDKIGFVDRNDRGIAATLDGLAALYRP